MFLVYSVVLLQVRVEWPAWPWWLVALAVGLALAALAYRERQPWTVAFRRYLALSRFVLGVALVLFVANPRLVSIYNEEIAPVLSIAVDDSRSVGRFLEGKTQGLSRAIGDLAAQARRAGWRVELTSLQRDTLATADSLRYTAPTTDLSALADKALARPRTGKLGALVIVSDGLSEQGRMLPLRPFGIPVHTLAVGDTTRRPDRRLLELRAPRLVAAGGRFQVQVVVASQGLPPGQAGLVLEQDGQIVGQRTLPLGGAARAAQAEFTLGAGAVGTRTLTARLQIAPGEPNTANNQATVFVEVAQLKKRLLLAAPAPHPDIKAIRAALALQDELEIVTYIPGIGPPPTGSFDAVVLHGYPAAAGGMPAVLQGRIGAAPVWYILAGATSVPAFNQANGLLQINGPAGQYDQVQAKLQAGFARFSLEGARQVVLDGLPPLSAPFGTYQLAGQAQVLAMQSVGPAETGRPLWLFGRAQAAGASTGTASSRGGGRATAVLCGEGLWQWRLAESVSKGSPATTDYLIQKTVQLLLSESERRRFRFRPQSQALELGQAVPFETSLEDATGQPVFGNAVELTVTALPGPGRAATAPRRLSLTNTDGTSGLQVAGLPAGAYAYTARTSLGPERFADQGRFSIRTLDAEQIDAGADYALLRAIARQTGGVAASLPTAASLGQALAAQVPPATLRSHTERDYLRRRWWIYTPLLLLALVEYALRKRKGGI